MMKDDHEYERLLTTREVAVRFHVDPKTVNRWAAQGKLTARRTSVVTAGTSTVRSAVF